MLIIGGRRRRFRREVCILPAWAEEVHVLPAGAEDEVADSVVSRLSSELISLLSVASLLSSSLLVVRLSRIIILYSTVWLVR